MHVFQWIAVAQLFSCRYHSYFHHYSKLMITLGRSPFLEQVSGVPSPRPYFAALGYSDSISADFLLSGLILIIAGATFTIVFIWNHCKEGYERYMAHIYDIAFFPLAMVIIPNLFFDITNGQYLSTKATCVFLLTAILMTSLVFARSCRSLLTTPPKPFAFGKFKYRASISVTVQPAAFECSQSYLGRYIGLEGLWLLLVLLWLFSLLPLPI